MRLNRFLASAGLGSRRGVEELITAGQVRINGHLVTDLATKVGPEDTVKVGARIVRQQQSLTAVLAKPRGYVCTADDECQRRTIFELLPSGWPRVHHVGRLDMDSEGLLIVTNDGDLPSPSPTLVTKSTRSTKSSSTNPLIKKTARNSCAAFTSWAVGRKPNGSKSSRRNICA